MYLFCATQMIHRPVPVSSPVLTDRLELLAFHFLSDSHQAVLFSSPPTLHPLNSNHSSLRIVGWSGFNFRVRRFIDSVDVD